MSKLIEKLFDENSFMKVGVGSDENLIFGYGTVSGRLVYCFSQDSQIKNGACDELQIDKIIRTYKMAVKSGAPIVGIFNSSGIVLNKGMNVMEKLGELYKIQKEEGWAIPQYMIVDGRCGGGLALAASMGDFLFVNEDDGDYFINSKDTLPKGDFKEKNQAVDYVGGEDEIVSKLRQLIDILPANTVEGPEHLPESTDLNRGCQVALGQDDLVRTLAKEVSDDGNFIETNTAQTSGVVTGFDLINGNLVGIVGNNRKEKESRLDTDGCNKMSKFVDFCDRFQIPVVTFVDVDGFACEYETEVSFSTAAANLVGVLAKAGVPRVNVIVGKSLGSCHGILNSHGLGVDYVFAWEGAEVGLMDSERYGLIYGEESDASYQGAVDKIIYPQDTRKYLIGVLETLV